MITRSQDWMTSRRTPVEQQQLMPRLHQYAGGDGPSSGRSPESKSLSVDPSRSTWEVFPRCSCLPGVVDVQRRAALLNPEHQHLVEWSAPLGFLKQLCIAPGHRSSFSVGGGGVRVRSNRRSLDRLSWMTAPPVSSPSIDAGESVSCRIRRMRRAAAAVESATYKKRGFCHNWSSFAASQGAAARENGSKQVRRDFH